MKNTDRDLCLFSLTLHKTQCLWHPVLSPHNLSINWQHIVESLSQEEKKHEEHKSDEAVQYKWGDLVQ